LSATTPLPWCSPVTFNRTDPHRITDILLKVVLNTIYSNHITAIALCQKKNHMMSLPNHDLTITAHEWIKIRASLRGMRYNQPNFSKSI